MTEIDIAELSIEGLTDLLGQAQSEMASRERQRRKALRAELERRVTAEGYKMGTSSPSSGAHLPAGPAASDPRSTATRRIPSRPGAGSAGRRSGCRRSSTSGGLM